MYTCMKTHSNLFGCVCSSEKTLVFGTRNVRSRVTAGPFCANPKFGGFSRFLPPGRTGLWLRVSQGCEVEIAS